MKDSNPRSPALRSGAMSIVFCIAQLSLDQKIFNQIIVLFLYSPFAEIVKKIKTIVLCVNIIQTKIHSMSL